MEAVARSDVLAYLIPGEQLERLRAEAGFEGLLAGCGRWPRRSTSSARSPTSGSAGGAADGPANGP
jgi:hypothetical protein